MENANHVSVAFMHYLIWQETPENSNTIPLGWKLNLRSFHTVQSPKSVAGEKALTTLAGTVLEIALIIFPGKAFGLVWLF